MTGRSSRDKGSRGELEWAALVRQHGFDAERTGRLGRTSEDVTHSIPDTWTEVKWRESLSINQWWDQAEKDGGSKNKVVAFRQSRRPWRVVVLADEYLRLKKMEAIINASPERGIGVSPPEE